MALVSPEGNYVKANKESIRQSLSQIRFSTFKDKETRENPGKFDTAPEEYLTVEVSDANLDKAVKSAYVSMKADPRFEEYADA